MDNENEIVWDEEESESLEPQYDYSDDSDFEDYGDEEFEDYDDEEFEDESYEAEGSYDEEYDDYEEYDEEDLSEQQEDVQKTDDRVANALSISKDNYTLSPAVVQISDIVIPVPIKDSRKETFLGMSKSVEELGVLNPIHVMVTEGYSEHLDTKHTPVGYEGPKYILIDGLRRIFSAKKNNLNHVNAMVWNFKDKEKGSEALLLISLILNKHQNKTWSEIWYMYQLLEESSSLTPGEIEYLLSLEAGDATKLKEVMTRADEFPEPKDDLLGKKKTLVQAFNALNKAMKEQDALVKEDISGVSGMEQVDGIVENVEDDTRLTDAQVKELLDMEAGEFELGDDDFDEMLNPAPEVQEVGNRHPLDPALKAESLAHDGYKCVCCGFGEFLPMRYKLAILQSHHKISVANKGPDSVENLATLCQSCHCLVHVLIWSCLKFGMSKEDFDNLPTDERERLKNIFKIAKIDFEAAKRLGKDPKDQFGGRRPNTFKMPGTDLRENMEAVKASKATE